MRLLLQIQTQGKINTNLLPLGLTAPLNVLTEKFRQALIIENHPNATGVFGEEYF